MTTYSLTHYWCVVHGYAPLLQGQSGSGEPEQCFRFPASGFSVWHDGKWGVGVLLLSFKMERGSFGKPSWRNKDVRCNDTSEQQDVAVKVKNSVTD